MTPGNPALLISQRCFTCTRDTDLHFAHSIERYFQMKAGYIKSALAATALICATIGTANAAGCMKGAVVGGVAGHYAGHHAVVGAVGGCLVGRHMAKKQAQEQAAQRQQAKAE